MMRYVWTEGVEPCYSLWHAYGCCNVRHRTRIVVAGIHVGVFGLQIVVTRKCITYVGPTTLSEHLDA